MRLSYSSDQDDEKPRSKRVPENLRKEMEAYVASLFKDHEKKILAKTEDLVKSNEVSNFAKKTVLFVTLKCQQQAYFRVSVWISHLANKMGC